MIKKLLPFNLFLTFNVTQSNHLNMHLVIGLYGKKKPWPTLTLVPRIRLTGVSRTTGARVFFLGARSGGGLDFLKYRGGSGPGRVLPLFTSPTG